MRRFIFARILFGTLGFIAFASVPASLVVAHEGHKMECNEIACRPVPIPVPIITSEPLRNALSPLVR